MYTISLWWKIAVGCGHIACIPLHLRLKSWASCSDAYSQQDTLSLKFIHFGNIGIRGEISPFWWKSLFFGFYEIMINFESNNRQSSLTGCKLNCLLTWFGSCCLKHIMKTGQTWPYRKDRDDCNGRVAPKSSNDSNNAPLFSK